MDGETNDRVQSINSLIVNVSIRLPKEDEIAYCFKAPVVKHLIMI